MGPCHHHNRAAIRFVRQEHSGTTHLPSVLAFDRRLDGISPTTDKAPVEDQTQVPACETRPRGLQRLQWKRSWRTQTNETGIPLRHTDDRPGSVSCLSPEGHRDCNDLELSFRRYQHPHRTLYLIFLFDTGTPPKIQSIHIETVDLL